MRKPLDTSRQPYPVEIVSHERVYDRHLKVDELLLRHGLFRGGMTPVISREVVGRGDAVCVLPYDPVRDEVVLAEQFRTSALLNGDRAWMTEIVAGLIEDGESLEDVALREMKEESGLEPVGPLIFINTVYATPGFCSERYHLFCAPVDAGKAGGVHGLARRPRISGFSPCPSQTPLHAGTLGKSPTRRPLSRCSGLPCTATSCARTGPIRRGLRP